MTFPCTSSLEWELIPEYLGKYLSVCPSVPLQIIMRTLFTLIICTFCYDISFKFWILHNPMVFPPRFFGFYGVPTYVESNDFFCLLPILYVSPNIFFQLRINVYNIMENHMLRSCLLSIKRFFCLLPILYVSPNIFFLLRIKCI